MKIILSHPTGNANVRSVGEALAGADMLYAYYTTVAVFQNNLLYKMGGISPFRDFRRRSYSPILQPYTKTYSKYEMGRMIAPKIGLKGLVSKNNGIFSVDSVYRTHDKKVASRLLAAQKKGADGIYAYEDGAEHSFKRARELGLKCLYDLPTGYWRAARKLLNEEIDRYPEWRNSFTGFKDSHTKLERKDHELALADIIFVASQFTAKTLTEFSGKLPHIKVIPYGFPPVYEGRLFEGFSRPRKLKLLFVGKLSQQKGLADIFESIKGLDKFVELTLVGSKTNCKILDIELAKHNYLGTKPHHEVLNIMREHDVLLFPSLFDGFGMVISEAMSQGTPVIASDRSAGPDLIRHGENGWLMKAGSPSSLREVIEEILAAPDKIEDIGVQAISTARQRPWQKYNDELIEVIREIYSAK